MLDCIADATKSKSINELDTTSSPITKIPDQITDWQSISQLSSHELADVIMLLVHREKFTLARKLTRLHEVSREIEMVS